MSTAELGTGNLWLHFTRTSDWLGDAPSIPTMDRAEGCYVWDTDGKRYLDALSALFCAQIGYGHPSMGQVARAQMDRLPFATNWSYAHQPAIDLAAALAERFPGDLNHFFFVNSGSEAVESAVKMAQQYHRLNGEPERTQVISRNYAYHGTTLGALGVTGLAGLREPFEPLRPVHHYVPNTNAYRPQHDDPAQAVEDKILEIGPDRVSLVIAEPVQNAGGCFTPPADYWPRLREICDRYGVLLACDEVITGFGRLGYWTGAEKYGVVPDLLTFAKGVTSAYLPLGGVGFNERISKLLQLEKTTMFVHGATWGGHPVAAAVALENLRLFDELGVLDNVRANESWFEEQLRGLYERHEIVGDVRGTGYFWALELVKDREHKVMFDAVESEQLLRGFLSARLLELGMICRADDRDEPVLQLSPPLIADRETLGEIIGILDQVLGEAAKRMVAL
ncbi:aspartate aminotransferase family protein [Egicoccus halophilus]|uniref:Aspartate aminotransferase family protein n=1 Tax=Egicoccus halophilus TaxID=1670830 RepID=A0A8J3A837_9ACTN|nr:aspartate aminotransferase family protein [Egicoccus halophilus]GGI04058.1 aspartate aminotransferase family protein [Egicoccus halophilus]